MFTRAHSLSSTYVCRTGTDYRSITYLLPDTRSFKCGCKHHHRMRTTSKTRQLFGVLSALGVVLFIVLLSGTLRECLSSGDVVSGITAGLYLLLIGGLLAGIAWGFLDIDTANWFYTRIGGVLALAVAITGSGVLVPGLDSGAWDSILSGSVFLLVGVVLGIFVLVVPRAVDRLQFLNG